ncbi:nitroreductase family protein [Thermosipho atlanticus]|uniref:Nitroreductase n=1 Tax=Thermosipho atlanticus DSM 15807 TaxID=1123380 RepID=A0A1M5SNI0_9BACT|nr:nitroreductase family protein [Thermosipho atlanticus]SHH40052.1 Nitroreductase [Thermosipho atlanticus DSM 15807]
MIFEFAKRRRTIRKFNNNIPPLNDILYAISTAKEAPSGMNSQPWHFLLITNQKIKDKIREIAEKAEKTFYENSKGKLKNFLLNHNINWKKEFLSNAPYLILVFSDKRFPFSKESTWLSIGYMLLALEEKNLSTVTYTPPNPKEISKIVNAPTLYNLEVILPIGYPNENKKKLSRKKLEKILNYDKF